MKKVILKLLKNGVAKSSFSLILIYNILFMKNYIIFGCLVIVTGCTTVGQQITNKNGVVQVKQQDTSIVTANQPQNVSTQAKPSTKSTNTKITTSVSTNVQVPIRVCIIE
jgi:uncharacterized membrane protein